MEQIFVYYDNKNQIIEFIPNNLNTEMKESIRDLWSQEIPRKIMMLLSTEPDIAAPKIKEQVGHSMSTLHENIKRLEDAGIIETKMIYVGNKQKVITPKVIFITKNSKIKEAMKNFLSKGFWIDSEKSNKIVEFLNKNPEKGYTAEEISSKIKIPVDEIHTLLSTWDSQITRAFSDFLKEKPFEKIVLYKGKGK